MSELRPLHTFFTLCWKQLGSGKLQSRKLQSHRLCLEKLLPAKNRAKSSKKGQISGNEDAYLFFPPHFVINLSLQTCKVFLIFIFLGKMFYFYTG
jgi:hypothetical protein